MTTTQTTPNSHEEELKIKTPKERDNLDLLELTLQLHSRALSYPSEKMHNAYMEARVELELRLQSNIIHATDKQQEEKSNKDDLFKAIEKINEGNYGSAMNFIQRYINSNSK